MVHWSVFAKNSFSFLTSSAMAALVIVIVDED